MKVILISGINGFLGSHLARYLSSEYKIIGLANNPDNLSRLGNCDFSVVKSTEENIKGIFKDHKIYCVIHAATVYKKNDESIRKLLESNIVLPIFLYDLANSYGTKFFLNTDTFFNFPNSNYNYLSEYTLSKKHALDWLLMIKGSCTLVNMKLYHMYGPMDSPNKFVSVVISKLKQGTDYLDLTPGNQKRDFIYVEDVCSAYQTVLMNLDPKDGVDYNFEIGTGQSTSIASFVTKIKVITESSTELRFGALAYRDNEIMDAVADNSEIQKLGWSPKISIEEGLKKIIFL